MADNPGFNLISVHDDAEDELVVHAGAARAVSPASAGEEPGEAVVSAVREAAASKDPSAVPQAAELTPEEAAHAARQEEIRRRREELEQAQAGLADPHTFSRMRIGVILALVALIVVIVVYTVVLPRLG